MGRNPALREIIKEALKPQLWTINDKGKPGYFIYLI